ncbi:MAG: hypothetical protein A2Z25_08350 [Planctomycetes bacterium RBG_16_55_9]|nr:MAG: hypothetical protein A2Z25_08350 [Planctomycetes bacterium RBG_16_55_9]
MQFLLSELNDSVLEQFKRIHTWHTIALVRVKSDQSKENIFGSGTLVSLDGEYGILTASHVTKDMEDMNEVGFCVGKLCHRLVIKRQHLSILYVGWCGKTTDIGPDISLVLIPTSEIGMIQAYKSFYPLDPSLENKVTESDSLDMDPYLISGYIGKWTIPKPQNGAFAGSHGLRPFIGIAESIENYSVRSDHDYCTVTVQYDLDNGNPEDFKGFSGAGLWKGRLYRDAENEIHVDDFNLNGVAYYQTPIECKSRKIICHAHRSISTTASYWKKHIGKDRCQPSK